jgi:tetratricopeptide (TPR) repeat protein
MQVNYGMQAHDTPDQAGAAISSSATHTFDQLAVQQDPLLGQIVGNYHLLARAGAGSFGTVYRARDVRLDRPVAVKFLTADQSPAARQRFEQEARALARLGRHPGVVDIYTWGEHEGRSYLALEYVPESAADLLTRRPGGLDLDQVLTIGVQCAEALAAARRAGIIHGDLKPSNILLANEGAHAKLCDFGMSTLCGATPSAGGSPAFLAPECARGGPSSHAADIYALGATLHTLLAGSPPVTETDPQSALSAAAEGRLQSLARQRPGLPKGVVDLLAQALSMDPARRPASAEDFAAALNALRNPSALRPRAARPLRRAATLAAALIVATLAVVAGPSLMPGGSGGTVLLADARLSLNQGDYAAARAGFEDFLRQQPDSAEARYGLGYAFLLEGDHEQASEEFAQLGEAAKQAEGKAAIAYMASGEAARPVLESAANELPNGYAAVLLSMLDMMAGNFSQAKSRLDQVQENQLPFDWQRRQYLQTLGQLHFKAGDFKAAEATFARLEQAAPNAAGGMAADYLAMAREQARESERVDTGERLARLKVLLDAQPATPDADAWSSRPLRLWVLPVEAQQGLILQESGLADVFPWRLSRALQGDTPVPLTPVDRSLEQEILAEQELAATLGDTQGALRLGRVLGARLLLQAKASRLFEQEILHVSLIDTETTRLTPVGEYEVARGMDANAWLQQIQDDLFDAVQKTYPLRGRIAARGDTLLLNIGTETGAQPGMHFRVLPTPGTPPLEGIAAVIAATTGDAESTVTLEGAPASAVPESGWLAEQAPAPEEAADAS